VVLSPAEVEKVTRLVSSRSLASLASMATDSPTSELSHPNPNPDPDSNTGAVSPLGAAKPGAGPSRPSTAPLASALSAGDLGLRAHEPQIEIFGAPREGLTPHTRGSSRVRWK